MSSACRGSIGAIPPWATVWGLWVAPRAAPGAPVGDGVGAMGGAPGCPRAQPSLPGSQARPDPQAPPTHAPRPRPPMPPGQPALRSFPRHFRHSSEMAPNPYI